MLDAEARLLLDLMANAAKDGRPALHTLAHAVGRKAIDKMSAECEAEPPEVAEVKDGTLPGRPARSAGVAIARLARRRGRCRRWSIITAAAS